MVFDIMTLFPDLVNYVLAESIIGRAQKNGAIEIATYNIRDYSEDKHRRVDDTPYGGGKGMLMMAPPIYNCYEAICRKRSEQNLKRRVIFMSPSGSLFNQKKAEELAAYDQLIILCGHYEGVDRRILDEIVALLFVVVAADEQALARAHDGLGVDLGLLDGGHAGGSVGGTVAVVLVILHLYA